MEQGGTFALSKKLGRLFQFSDLLYKFKHMDVLLGAKLVGLGQCLKVPAKDEKVGAIDY